MGKTITQYQADDGELFATEVEMLAHEARLDAVRIHAWVAAVPDWARGEEARARRLVAAFLAFERGGVAPPAVLDSDEPQGDDQD